MKDLMEKFDFKFKAWFTLRDKNSVVYSVLKQWIKDNFVPNKAVDEAYKAGRLNALDNYEGFPDQKENL